MKILIAEDDCTSRNILTSTLRKWGYDVVVVTDGIAAWEILQQPDGPRLALLDWIMPGMDGLEVCRLLREHESFNPHYVIMLTSKGAKSDIVRGLDGGANDYISKPWDNDELKARIRVGARMLELQSALVEARDVMAHQALHDPLTGIYNRRATLETLDRQISRVRREGGRLIVGMLDFDHFKRINDTYGHQVGDEVLVGFVNSAQKTLREYDFIGRYGGEEFLVIVAGPSDELFEGLFERLRRQVAETPVHTSVGPISITVSIGTVIADGSLTIDDVLSSADRAMYCAKSQGRNRVCHSTQGFTSALRIVS